MSNRKKSRILMIEDSEPERRAFEAYTRDREDVERVWFTSNVDEGIRILTEEHPDAVVLDWYLEGPKHGDDFLKEAKALDLGDYRPRVFVASVNKSPDAKSKAGDSGLVPQYLLKGSVQEMPAYIMQKIHDYLDDFSMEEAEVTSITDLLGRKQPETGAELHPAGALISKDALWRRVTDIMRKLGLTPAESNYLAMSEVLTRTILLRAERGETARIKLESEVYAKIELKGSDGKKLSVNGIRSGVRTAVNVIYSRAGDELRKSYCPNEGDPKKGSPEPKQFVLAFADNFVKENQDLFPMQDCTKQK